MNYRADVLIVTVTSVESLAVLKVFHAATETNSAIISIGDRSYHDLGVVNDVRVCMAVSEMGSSGLGGSQNAISKGIEALNPDAVIMVGIAFGIDQGKQTIGDILISKQLLFYDLQRIGKDDTRSRGDKVHASSRLINQMRNADLKWSKENAKVTLGLVLSGSKLVDNHDYRNQLVSLAPEAIGGEMEGEGLYVACHDKKVDWILVKAICDWADGNKNTEKTAHQELAAHNAASFILHALQVAPLKRSGTLFKEREVDIVSAFAKIIEHEQPIPSGRKYPEALINKEIQRQLTVLQRARFFPDFSTSDYSLALGDKLKSGEFEGGSGDARCVALAWCARVLVNTEHKAKSAEFLQLAKSLGDGAEVKIAEAFIISADGKVDDALGLLAKIPSPTARSAALIIVMIHRGADAGIDWLSKAGFTQLDLDPDGKVFLTGRLFDLGYWDTALEHAKSFSEETYQRAPVLLYLSAVAHLAQAVPEELRPSILQAVPYEVDTFPIASNDSSLLLRRKAGELFSKSVHAARELKCLHAANISDDYFLWLKLLDPETNAAGLEILQSNMRNPEQSLRRLHFAVKFGLKLDIEAVEREIDRQTALTGDSSQNVALGRFTLALLQKSPAAVAEYIDRHKTQLCKHLAKQFVQKVEIEMLARSGADLRAETLFAELISDGLPENEQSQLRIIIAQPPASSQKTALIEEFESSDSLIDLQRLVDFLEVQADWQQLCNFASKLFAKTQSVSDAERLAIALDRSKRHGELTVLLNRYPEFLDQSDRLKSLWCWLLYREGALAESTATLQSLRSKRDHPNDRSLLINLAVTSGDWKSLIPFVEEEWAKREERDADDLLQTARLAQLIGSVRAKELVHASVEKTAVSAEVLVGAYSLATNAGWEIENGAAQWLNRAAELSDENGPIRKLSLREIIDRQPEWNLLENDIVEKLSHGVLPIFAAARVLNRTLADMFLVRGLANVAELDPRKRSIVPAYSGTRPRLHMDYQVVALDATALLTLGTLDLLEVLHETFSLLVVPHSTLEWLFDEKSKTSFHQPSRIRDAHELRRLLAVGALKQFCGNIPSDADLSAEIGEDLALLLAEARVADAKKKFVITPSPVHRITSLMEEEADLTPYYPYLCSCTAVVNKLKQKGQLTMNEEKKARCYLKLHEKDWPHQPELPDRAVLYLDDISVTYLQHTGLLGKLKAAGLEVYVSARETEGLNALLNYEHLTAQVSTVFEGIRSFLAAGIKSGKIKVAATPVMEETDKAIFLNHPSMSIFRLAKNVDTVIVDDRTLNQNWNLAEEDRQIPIATTLDLLDAFHAKGNIALDQLFDSWTKLRCACYVFVPIMPEELAQYLSDSQIVDSRIVETAELKAVREYLLLIRMSGFLQLPKEALWIDGIMQTLLQTLKAQWGSDIDEVIAAARSDWLLGLFDIRGWVHCFKDDRHLNIAEAAYGKQLLSLILASAGMPYDTRTKFGKWLDSSLLNCLKNENPNLYLKIVDGVQEVIVELGKTDISEEVE